MFARSLLRDVDVQPLAEGVYATLEKVGVLCQNEDILRAIEARGARVDYAAEHAFFPRRMVEEFVEDLRKNASAEAESGHRRFSAPGLPGVGIQIAQFYYDYARGERRPGNRNDFIELMKFGTALHPEAGVGHGLVLSDVPAMLEPLEAALLLVEYGAKPHPPFAWYAAQIPYLREMGDILGRKDWFAFGATCFAHPLRMEKAVADKFVMQLRSGAKSAGITAMPVAGVTTPVTLGGFIAVTSAEHLAAWMCARAIRPDVGLGGSTWPGTVDMRTGAVSYCAFDALWYGFVAAEFLRRFCGVQIQVSGGDYCDAKVPGLFAVLEKAYKVMTLAAFTGRHGSLGSGMLDEGKVISPVQMLLERDWSEGVRFFGRSARIDADSIALESILEAGLCLEKGYIELEHTARHFREALWLPAFYDRSGYDGHDQEEAILKKAQARVDELIASYQKPETDPDKLAAMRQVVERARRELV